MKRAILLAKKGLSWTNPNPLVGAILVKNGVIIGKGYHHGPGLPHGEIEALNSLKISAGGSTMYVNLEPCVHTDKRTPPCTEAIIKSGIKKVVCATLDPNPKVNGLGVKRLEEAGIEVSVGLMEKEARQLNETYFTYHIKKRPFVALKFASSLDGKIATYSHDSKWITNQKTRDYARRLRLSYQSILVGVNTVLRDNPHLGVGLRGKKDPIRIILDSSLKIPLSAQVLRDNNVIIATTNKANKNKLRTLQKKGIIFFSFKGQQIPLKELVKRLYQHDIISVFVEGGGEVLGSFLDDKLVDKVYAFFAPILIGGEKAKIAVAGHGFPSIKAALHLKDTSLKKFNSDLLVTGYTFL